VNVPGVTLEENSIFLEAGERREVEVVFDSSEIDEGVYVGGIKIVGDTEESFIPIVFEVESVDLFFDINLDIPPQYLSVEAGKNLLAQVKVFDLISGGTQEGLGSTTVDMEYYLYNFEGEALSYESESIVVDRQTKISKSVSIPDDMVEGDYVFVSIARYASSVGMSSQLFSVVGRDGAGVFLSPSEKNNPFSLIVIVVVLFFLGMMFLFVYLIKDRDKLVMEMKRFNSQELKHQKEFLIEQQNLLLGRKRVGVREVKKEVRENVKKIKRKHKSRISVLKKLKRRGGVGEMRKRLSQWKKEGYNVGGMEYKLKGLTTGEMKSLMSKWKKEYKIA